MAVKFVKYHLNYLVNKSRALNFAFRKLESNTIYNGLPFKYYLSIFKGQGGAKDMIFLLLKGDGVSRVWENMRVVTKM